MPANNNDINISVTFRHTESTPALKQYATEKLLHRLQKYISVHAEAQVILSVEKRDHTAEVILHSKDFDVTCKGVTEDLYSAIDKVLDTVEAQIRKQKDRLRDHKHQSPREADFGS